MATAALATVISHWSKLIENLQASPQEFYASVEKAIEKREIPGAKISRGHWAEGGPLSPQREYLRVVRGEHTIDICGAPFGTGFFVSSWLSAPLPGVVAGVLGVLIGIAALGWSFSSSGAKVAAYGSLFRGVAVLGIVVVGFAGIIRPLFFPPRPTYYRIDTATMFQSAVHAAVLEVIDDTTSTKGLRALTELERKPVLREFYNYRR